MNQGETNGNTKIVLLVLLLHPLQTGTNSKKDTTARLQILGPHAPQYCQGLGFLSLSRAWKPTAVETVALLPWRKLPHSLPPPVSHIGLCRSLDWLKMKLRNTRTHTSQTRLDILLKGYRAAACLLQDASTHEPRQQCKKQNPYQDW